MSPTGSSRGSSFDEPKKNGYSHINGGIRLFVDGLAKSIDYVQLRRLFEKFGTVTNVYVPRNLKRGRRTKFGFVHFSSRQDGIAAMEAVHGLKMHNTFISVNPARFTDRRRSKRSTKARHEARKRPPKMKQVWRKKESTRTKRRTGPRQVWRVKEKPIDDSLKNPTIDVKMTPEVVVLNTKLSRLLVATTHEVLSCGDITLWLAEKQLTDLQVKPFGAKEKILEFESNEERNKFMNANSGIDGIFLSLQPLEIPQQPKDYLIWIKIWKIPIGLWSVDFISKIASKLGSVVCVDAATTKGSRFDVARVLIAAPDPILENQIIPITVGSMDLNVLVEIEYIFDENIDPVGECPGEDDQDEAPISTERKGAFKDESLEEQPVPEFSPPASDSDDRGMAGGRQSVFEVATLKTSNDGVIIDTRNMADNEFNLVKHDMSSHLPRVLNHYDRRPFNALFNSWEAIISNNLLKIIIPNGCLTSLLFGRCFQFCPSEVLGQGLIRFGLEGRDNTQAIEGTQAIERNFSKNGVVLKELTETPSSSNPSYPSNSNYVEVFSDGGEHENSARFDEDLLKKVKQGVSRTTKLKSLENLELNCAKPGVSKHKRGRKPKSVVGPSILREITEGSGCADPNLLKLQESAAKSGAGAYFTRATKVWFLGKSVGLVYPGSDEEAIKGLAEELEEDHPFLPSS